VTAFESTRPGGVLNPRGGRRVPSSRTGRTAFAGLLAFTCILIVSPQAWFPVLGSLRIALVAAAGGDRRELLDRR
jgi:hypothetical protein